MIKKSDRPRIKKLLQNFLQKGLKARGMSYADVCKDTGVSFYTLAAYTTNNKKGARFPKEPFLRLLERLYGIKFFKD